MNETITPIPKGMFPKLDMTPEVRTKIITKRADPVHKSRADMTEADILVRWPALVAHMICESLGYATPTLAAMIIKDAIQNKENWCEWVYSCYGKDPKKPLKSCIRNRHGHKGYMAEFRKALSITFTAMLTSREPQFASWF